MTEENVLNEEFAEAKRLALDIVDDVVNVRAHCAACAWIKLAACMVLWGVDDQIEEANEAIFNEDEDDEDTTVARMEQVQHDMWASSALRLYAVADSAMRQRWSDKDGARASAIGNDAYIARRPYLRALGNNATLSDCRREAGEIVNSVFRCEPRDPEDAWLSIAVCAVLSGIDPGSDAADTAVATRVYALLGLVQDAWEWLIEGADVLVAVGEAGLLMANGDLPAPEQRHTTWLSDD